MYVPDKMVGEMRKAIRNGRRLRELINKAGIRYLTALKKQRESKSPRHDTVGDA